MQQKFKFSRQFFKDVWYLTKSYWKSEESFKAFALLGVILALTFGVVYMLVMLNSWYNSFYSALQAYEKEKIISELWRFCYLAAIYIILAVSSFYLQQCLIINWRRWLTEKFLDIWMRNKTYYNLQMFGHATDNPDQRISEDISLFVEMTLGFTIGVLKALFTFVSFFKILYNISGPLHFEAFGRAWTIEGYMFWAALIYSTLGTYVTHLVGRKLVALNFIQQKYEADFRFSMIRMRESAESVAFYGGEEQEKLVFKERFKQLMGNFWKLISKRKDLVWLNSGYSQIAIIFPFMVAIDRYLIKEISLGGLMQISSAFGHVQTSLSYFADSYSSLAQWQAVVLRLTDFGRHMDEVSKDADRFHMERFATADKVVAEAMQVNLPNGEVLLQPMSFVLEPGRNVLVKGRSGCGKSTLLRAISGIWPYVGGKIHLPDKESLMFIPQKPYLPLGSLREALLYPGKKQLEDAEIIRLMELCQIGYLKDQLDLVADWSHVLSVGEQQRLAFVRAHIQRPLWLFLDEATSALDEDTEAIMYELLGSELEASTVVSVGHRSTLSKYHQLVMFIDKDTQTVSVDNNKDFCK